MRNTVEENNHIEEGTGDDCGNLYGDLCLIDKDNGCPQAVLVRFKGVSACHVFSLVPLMRRAGGADYQHRSPVRGDIDFRRSLGVNKAMRHQQLGGNCGTEKMLKSPIPHATSGPVLVVMVNGASMAACTTHCARNEEHRRRSEVGEMETGASRMRRGDLASLSPECA